MLDAVYPLARDRRSFPEHISEGLEPHAVDDVWLFASAAPEVLVDISAGFTRKVEARLAHQSQTCDPNALADDWRRRAAALGASTGLSLAEDFVVLRSG